MIASPFQPIGALSGGNQQKVVLSRAALQQPEVLIIDEPTQGVDAKARLDIYSLITRVAEEGVAVLVNSSDSSELAGLCDRVYIVADGSIIDEASGDLTESGIVRRFVSTTDKPEQIAEEESQAVKRFARLLVSPWVPVGVLAVLTILLSVYTGARAPLFFESFNLNNILLSALPLVWIAIGQQFCLLVGELDISIGATTTLSVVLASFLLDTGSLGAMRLGVARDPGGRRPGRLVQLAAHAVLRGQSAHRHDRNTRHRDRRLHPPASPARGSDRREPGSEPVARHGLRADRLRGRSSWSRWPWTSGCSGPVAVCRAAQSVFARSRASGLACP